jgi:YegS/Rv2252/BmrU family lipid kinase
MQINVEQKPKTFVVINPVAGVQPPETVHEKIRSILEAHEIPYEIYETTPNSKLRNVVRSAIRQGFELFIAAGGDGTLSSVATGLVNTNIPMVIIPSGTWNALARNLDIPLQVDQALALIFQEHDIRTIDAMQVADEYYILNVSTGLGSQTMKEVKREEKRHLGKLPDLWRGFRRMLEFPSYRFDVKIDGKLTTFRASELIVANIRNVGVKSLQLDTGIHMDDGKLNVCRIYAESLRDYFNLAISMLTGTQDRNWNVLCLEASHEVLIDSNRKLLVQGDGDIIGRLPIAIKIHPKAISIVTPPNAQT